MAYSKWIDLAKTKAIYQVIFVGLDKSISTHIQQLDSGNTLDLIGKTQ